MRTLAAIAAVLPLAGCTSIGYYAQAVSGHLHVVWAAQPIEDRLNDAATPETLRAKLARVLVIREFASKTLGLPDNGSYRRYADIGRRYVVWNVFAAPEFSLEPVKSCFLFAGCVSYRGYYSEEEAREVAASFAARGDDAHVSGSPAYSTLGWFDDPVLSTFINYPEVELARLLFHELAHQVVYVKDDTTFNESFATAVEEEGVNLWLAQQGGREQRPAYAESRRRRAELVSFFLKYHKMVAEYYARTAPLGEKRAGKRRLFAQMEDDYRALKSSWGGFAGYDRLFAGGANNALLVSIASYEQQVPAFKALLAKEKGDFAAFYAAARDLADLGKAERDARLVALVSN